MNKKILSLALACTMLAATVAQAAENLSDYVKNNAAYADYLENNLFSYSKYNEKLNKTPKEVAPEIVTEVKLSSGAAYEAHPTSALLGNATDKSFDYKATLKMDAVKAAFNALHAQTELAIDLDSSKNDTEKSELKAQFNNSTVEGEFKVFVTYDSAKLTHAALTATDIVLKQNDTTPAIFELDAANCDFAASPAVVAFKVKGTPTVAALKANANHELDDLTVEISNFTAAVENQNLAVSVSMTGKTTIKDSGIAYGVIDYASKDRSDNNYRNNIAIVNAKTRSSSGGSLGGGGTTTAPKAYTVVDDKTTDINVVKEGTTYTVKLGDIEAPVKEGYTFEGWYLDKDFTKSASGDVKITEDTYFYAKFTPVTEAAVYTVIDGENNKQELIEEEGKKYFDMDSLTAPEKTGYAFEGWYKNPYFTEAATGKFEVTDTVRLYPHFINIVAPEQLISDEHIIYIVGYPDGTVKPNANITREEVVAAFYRLLKPEFRATVEATENNFPDVDAKRWSNASISTMANAGFIVGDSEGKFNPTAPITRAEFAVIASKFAPKDAAPAANTFTDIDNHWAKDAILKVAGQCWITGYEDGSFRPDAKITRAEAMTIINKMLVRYGDHETGYAKSWSDVSKTDWFYDAVIEATTYNLYERHENGWSETWTGNGEEKTNEEAAKIIENENLESLK